MSSPLPKVTLVVVPRERFSYSRISLESIYQNTLLPFELVYVDGNSPKPIRKYLAEQSKIRHFRLIRSEHYLFPNHARNIGLATVETPYIVFLDNDVVVQPGWLNKLLRCAEDTGAAIVGPLMCHEEPIHEIVHFAGGESRVVTDIKGRRHLREKMYRQGQIVADIRDRLQRCETELCEFHCMLVKRDVFNQTGLLDERLLNTKEHLDFCMTVSALGQSVYFEPDSIVTYVPGPLLTWSDLHFYMLRWSNAWELSSLGWLQKKWNLSENSYFKQKRKALGWRRRDAILQPLLERLGIQDQRSLSYKLAMYGLLAPVESLINLFLTQRYAHKHLDLPQTKPNDALASFSYEANR